MDAAEASDQLRLDRVCSQCGQGFAAPATFCPVDGCILEGADLTDVNDPLLGTVIADGYRVLKIEGDGGVAVVYRVLRETDKHPLAMKVLREDLAADPVLRERFSREAQAIAQVKHPNLVRITGVGALPGARPYFLMELLEGQTLARFKAELGRVPAGLVTEIAVQIARALCALHSAGVVHRDLKPSNVQVAFSDGRATVTLFDLGMARIAGAARLTLPGMVHGTPNYMAPEQAMGDALDDRTDIYSFGVVLYELLAGTPPFHASTSVEVLQGHLLQTVPPLPAEVLAEPLARDLEQVVMRCLKKLPAERYDSVADLEAALAALAST